MSVAELVPGFVRSGKVRDLFALDDARLLLVAIGSHQRVRRRAADADPGQGPRADRHLALLVRRDDRSRDHAQPPALHGRCRRCPASTRAQAAELRGRIDDLPPRRCAAGRVDRPRLPRRQWLEGLRPHRRRVRHSAAGRPARERAPAGAAVHALDQGGGRATTRTSSFDQMVALVGAAASRAGTRPWRSRCTSSRRRARNRPGIILADTKFEFGIVDERRDDPHRRGADARLVALLGCRRPTSRAAPRTRSTSSTCATSSRRSTGTRRTPGRSCRPRSSTGTRAALRRGVRADHGRLVRALPRGGRRSADEQRSASPSTSCRATASSTLPGKAVEDALPQLDADNVHEVRVGRRVELTRGGG